MKKLQSIAGIVGAFVLLLFCYTPAQASLTATGSTGVIDEPKTYMVMDFPSGPGGVLKSIGSDIVVAELNLFRPPGLRPKGTVVPVNPPTFTPVLPPKDPTPPPPNPILPPDCGFARAVGVGPCGEEDPGEDVFVPDPSEFLGPDDPCTKVLNKPCVIF